MTATELLAELTHGGIHLTTDGNHLLYDAPQGALTPGLLATIREHKLELLALLSQGPAGSPVPDMSADDELAMEREAIQKGENAPSRWSRLADSGLHHGDVVDHAEVVFLFACELILDPSKAGEDCQTRPAMWAHYSPFWRERLTREAFEELEQRYRRRLLDLGLHDEARFPQGPKALRPLVLNAEGTGCAVCGGAEYWVSTGGVRHCLNCHPAFYRDAIAIGRIARQEEPRRPSMRRRRRT